MSVHACVQLEKKATEMKKKNSCANFELSVDILVKFIGLFQVAFFLCANLWKCVPPTWVLENQESPGILFWHFLESAGKRPLVLESYGNLLNKNQLKNMKCMEGSKEN